MHMSAAIFFGQIHGIEKVMEKVDQISPVIFIDIMERIFLAFDYLCNENEVARIDTSSGYLAFSSYDPEK